MATITAQQLVNRVKNILNDSTSIRWPEIELLGYLNDAQREIVLLRPDALTKTESVALTVNNTKQQIPSAGIRLMSVVRNMGSDGQTPGKAVRLVDRAVLDTQVPDWHSSEAATEVAHYVFDPINPKVFYVYPRVGTAKQVEIIYSASPVDIAIGATITIDDIYANAIINYIFYRAYSKDAEYAQNPNLAASYWNSFVQELGLKTQVDTVTDPNSRPFMSPGMDR